MNIKAFMLATLFAASVVCSAEYISSATNYSEALSCFESDNLVFAKKALERVDLKRKEYSYGNVLLGLILYYQGDYRSAKKYIDKYIDMTKEDSAVLNKRFAATTYLLRVLNMQQSFRRIKAVTNIIEITTKKDLWIERAIVYYEIASNDKCPRIDRNKYSGLSVAILQKYSGQVKNDDWFNNVFGRALICRQEWVDGTMRKRMLVRAQKEFARAIEISKSAIYYHNLAIAIRLSAEEYSKEFWNETARKPRNLKMMKAAYIKAMKYYTEANEALDNAMIAEDINKYRDKIDAIRELTSMRQSEFSKRTQKIAMGDTDE